MAHLTSYAPMRWLMQIAIMIVVPRTRMGAGVVLFNEGGDVLLLKHAFHGDKPWGIPGGWLNRNEAPALGAIRELREETNLAATLGEVAYLERNPRQSAVDVVYIATEPQGEIKVSYEIIEAIWVSPDELPLAMPVKLRTAIEQATAIHRKRLEPC